MKLDKEFAVRVNGKLFTANEIFKINIDGSKFNMTCYCGSGSAFDITAWTRDVEFVSVPQIPKLAHGGVVTGRDRTHTYTEHVYKVGDEPASDIELVSPLETMKQAFKEAIGEMGGIGGGSVQADMIVDGAKFGQLVHIYNQKHTGGD
jgi:hypothetical protein